MLQGIMEDVLSEIAGEIMDEVKGGLPPGFRFHPTDEELITFYLASKVFNGSFCGIQIAEIDLNRCEPWDLPDVAKMGEKEWYFFSLRDRKYPTGLRTNRATGAGYWKATGKDREVHSASTGSLLGMKKTLVFYRGRAPRGEKTKWVMHEYRLDGDFSCRRTGKEEWVICRIFLKTMERNNPPIYPEGQTLNKIINVHPHHHPHHQEIYNPSHGTKLFTNPTSPSLFIPSRDLLIPPRDSGQPVPRQCCKAEEADNRGDNSTLVFPPFLHQNHHHQQQLLLPDLASAGQPLHHGNTCNEIFQNPNLLIFEMGCLYGGMNRPGSGDPLEMAGYNVNYSSCSSSSAAGRAIFGSSWPLLDP
ncbi:hypothetical protein SAY87_031623 [Trapa incisa]|uniref:NAC domain-containing protein n=1 Tax=Trapa incisa TaxID=236973 RepID=A0AAN7QLV1_9MYRT|nr:hypothetical protein SAY87_031623 [Trapa incisa]